MRYDAFLSYSHAADDRLAAAVQSALQRFARPWYRTYALRVFRDETGLSADPSLWNSIERALDTSDHLLLLASPQSAASPWVQREIDCFVRRGGCERVLIVLTGGEIAWSAATGDFDWTRTTALPSCLAGKFHDEPLYVDFSWAHPAELQSLRRPRFRNAILDLAAPLHGKTKDELDSEDLRQHRKTLQIAWSAVALLAALAIALAFASFYAMRQRDEARRQAHYAEEQRKSAVEQSRIAGEQRRVAEERQQMALSRQLAAQALDDLPHHLDVALLESVAATRVRPTREALSALLASLLYSPHLRQFVRGSPERLAAGALSRDGNVLATLAEESGTVNIRRLNSSVGAGVLARNRRVKTLALSADGNLLALAAPGEIAIRDVRTGAVKRSLLEGLEGAFSAPAALTFSADGRKLAAYDSGAGILVWDLASGRLQLPPLRPKRWESALAFSGDGKLLGSGAHDGSIQLWSADEGRPLGPALRGHKQKIFQLLFSPDRAILASASEDRTIVLWDVKTAQPLGPPLAGHAPWPLGHDAWGLSLAFSPDGALLASAAKDKSVMLWDVAGRTALGPPLKGHVAPPMAVAFSKDARSLVSLGQDNTVIRWSTEPESLVGAVLPGHGEGVLDLAFSADGKMLAAASLDHRVTLWDAVRRRPLRRSLGGYEKTLLAVAFSPDTRSLLSAAKDRIVSWNLLDGRLVQRTLARMQTEIVAAAFSLDGHSAFGDEAGLMLSNPRGSAPVRLPVARASAGHSVTALAFSPDGRVLASGGFDGTLALWDVASKQLLRPAVQAHPQAVRSLAFSPDGNILATAGVGTADFDENVKLWEVRTGRALPPALAGHSGPVRALAFRPDGRMLACAAGGSIMLWDLESRESIGAPIEGQAGPVLSLAFSPNGDWLASGGYDDRVILWDLRLDDWRERACREADRTVGAAEWKRLAGDVPYQNPCR